MFLFHGMDHWMVEILKLAEQLSTVGVYQVTESERTKCLNLLDRMRPLFEETDADE